MNSRKWLSNSSWYYFEASFKNSFLFVSSVVQGWSWVQVFFCFGRISLGYFSRKQFRDSCEQIHSGHFSEHRFWSIFGRYSKNTLRNHPGNAHKFIEWFLQNVLRVFIQKFLYICFQKSLPKFLKHFFLGITRRVTPEFSRDSFLSCFFFQVFSYALSWAFTQKFLKR